MATLDFGVVFRIVFRSTVERVGFPSTRTSMLSFTEMLFPGRRAAIPNFVMDGKIACIDSNSAVPFVLRTMRSESSEAIS